jgi:hypothetical protein
VLSLLSEKVRQFIHQHANDDERELVLKYKAIEGVPLARIAEQIAGRRKRKINYQLFTVHQIYYIRAVSTWNKAPPSKQRNLKQKL